MTTKNNKQWKEIGFLISVPTIGCEIVWFAGIIVDIRIHVMGVLSIWIACTLGGAIQTIILHRLFPNRMTWIQVGLIILGWGLSPLFWILLPRKFEIGIIIGLFFGGMFQAMVLKFTIPRLPLISVVISGIGWGIGGSLVVSLTFILSESPIFISLMLASGVIVGGLGNGLMVYSLYSYKETIVPNREIHTNRYFLIWGMTSFVVILVLILIFPSQGGNVKVDATNIQIRGLMMALNSYCSDNNHYPNTKQGLLALLSNPMPKKIPQYWQGPYIRSKRIPEDGWGRGFKYISNGKSFEIISYGADNKLGGEDSDSDIVYSDIC